MSEFELKNKKQCSMDPEGVCAAVVRDGLVVSGTLSVSAQV